jgi:hypothetical protein
MFGFLNNQWGKKNKRHFKQKKKNQHIWGNTCITLDDIELQTPHRAKHDDHNPRSSICPSDFISFVKLQLFCAKVHNTKICEARTKGWRACYLLCI